MREWAINWCYYQTFISWLIASMDDSRACVPLAASSSTVFTVFSSDVTLVTTTCSRHNVTHAVLFMLVTTTCSRHNVTHAMLFTLVTTTCSRHNVTTAISSYLPRKTCQSNWSVYASDKGWQRLITRATIKVSAKNWHLYSLEIWEIVLCGK